jgi:hypothetical protein
LRKKPKYKDERAMSSDKFEVSDDHSIANSLSTEVANLPEYVSRRQASGFEISKGRAPAHGIRGADGK